MIEREGEQFRPSTYLEFRKRYEAEGSPEKEWLTPASKAVRSLDNQQMMSLVDSLGAIAMRIAEKTGVPSSLPTGSSHGHKG
jgi:hypothetical protein